MVHRWQPGVFPPVCWVAGRRHATRPSAREFSQVVGCGASLLSLGEGPGVRSHGTACASAAARPGSAVVGQGGGKGVWRRSPLERWNDPRLRMRSHRSKWDRRPLCRSRRSSAASAFQTSTSTALQLMINHVALPSAPPDKLVPSGALAAFSIYSGALDGRICPSAAACQGRHFLNGSCILLSLDHDVMRSSCYWRRFP